MWVGGEFGLAVLAGGRFRPVTGRNGTEFEGTSGIVETPDGEVWLHGAIGITRIPADEVRRVLQDSTYQVEHERLDFRDGLEGAAQQIRPQPTVITGTDGRLWFATTLSLAWLDPRAISAKPVPPPVVIRRLTAGEQVLPGRAGLRLPVETTALRIDYTALSLSIPERVRFRYQLVGSDTGWQDVGGRREAFYTNLGPGPIASGSSRRTRTGSGTGGRRGRFHHSTLVHPDPLVPRSSGSPASRMLIWLAYLARVRQVAGGMRAALPGGTGRAHPHRPGAARHPAPGIHRHHAPAAGHRAPARAATSRRARRR